MKLKRNNIELLTDGLTSFFAVQEYKDILRFAVEDIDLSGDVSADKDRVDLINYPYIVEPLTACTI